MTVDLAPSWSVAIGHADRAAAGFWCMLEDRLPGVRRWLSPANAPRADGAVE